MAKTSVHVLTLLGGGALLGLVALFAYAPIFSVDAFWHLKLGQVIVENGAIPDRDLFSAVHPDKPYVQFQWLWDVLAYSAARSAGLHGVRLFSVATLVLGFATLGLVAARAFTSRALAFAFVALALVLFEDRFQTRPSATVLGFTAAMLPVWLRMFSARRFELPFVFLLSCLWSNIHGGEALLAVLGAGALAVGDQLAFRLNFAGVTREARQRSLMVLGAALLGTLASPTLVAGLADWSWAIQPQLATGNKEWLPTYTMLENGFTPSFVLIALGPSLVAIAYVWEQVKLLRSASEARSYPLAEWLLCAGLLALSQHAVRNAFLCIVPLAFTLRRAAPHMTHARAPHWASGVGATLLLVALDDHVLQGYGGLAEARAVLRYDLAPATFPDELSTFVREAKIEGGIFNDARWGGYLIWELWPDNHVFVDSRQDLTPEMWPLFLAAQTAGSRPPAMDEAFRRWGIGLSAFRGPTFPAVRAPASWQLLYKAGDQELYQRRDAPNAEANIARARHYLEARARNPQQPLETLAIEVGSTRFLAADYQRFRAQQADALMSRGDVEDACEGLRLKASLWFEAGLYPAALAALETLLQSQPDNSKALYQAALAALALGDDAKARALLRKLAPMQAALSPQQRNRLKAIDPTDFF